MFRKTLIASAATLAFLSSSVFAQEAAPVDPEAPSADIAIVDIYSDADAAAVLAARIVALKTVLELTLDQVRPLVQLGRVVERRAHHGRDRERRVWWNRRPRDDRNAANGRAR